MPRTILFLFLQILFCSFFFPANCPALDLMLAQVYEDGLDISGWLVSEKLDGVRGIWDGKRLLSKQGNAFQPPPEFVKNFPDFPLEGELWGGRNTFEQTVAIVKRQGTKHGWLTLKFAIFDVPEKGSPFLPRLEKAEKWFSRHPSDYAFIIPQTPVRDKNDLQERLQIIEKLGGEGLIVRKAKALYTSGRSDEILKVKSFQDTEAVVVDHLPGAGRNKDRLGSLLVELPDGKRFKIGTGFTDGQRENPPPIGTTITFKYYGLYQSGLPKFPSFLRVREKL